MRESATAFTGLVITLRLLLSLLALLRRTPAFTKRKQALEHAHEAGFFLRNFDHDSLRQRLQV
jgi:hypothetical protein